MRRIKKVLIFSKRVKHFQSHSLNSALWNNYFVAGTGDRGGGKEKKTS